MEKFPKCHMENKKILAEGKGREVSDSDEL